jgi:hypothetical protein
MIHFRLSYHIADYVSNNLLLYVILSIIQPAMQIKLIAKKKFNEPPVVLSSGLYYLSFLISSDEIIKYCNHCMTYHISSSELNRAQEICDVMLILQFNSTFSYNLLPLQIPTR